jgi:hypothetical protein
MFRHIPSHSQIKKGEALFYISAIHYQLSGDKKSKKIEIKFGCLIKALNFALPNQKMGGLKSQKIFESLEATALNLYDSKR